MPFCLLTSGKMLPVLLVVQSSLLHTCAECMVVFLVSILIILFFYRDGVDTGICIVVLECMTRVLCSTRCQGSKVIYLLVQEGLPRHYRLYNR